MKEGWARDWGLYMASHLPVQPGSRLAMGLPPQDNPPIMKFLVPIPDELLYDDPPGHQEEEDTVPMPGQATRCVEVPATLDDLLETEEEERRWRVQREERWQHESLREEERILRDTEYLQSLVARTESRKRRMVVVTVRG